MKNRVILELLSKHFLRWAFLFFIYKTIECLILLFRNPADVSLRYGIIMSVLFAIGSLLMAMKRKAGLYLIYGASGAAIIVLATLLPETESFHPLQKIIGLLILNSLFSVVGYFFLKYHPTNFSG